MHEQINEKVSVVLVYDRGRGTVLPRRIRWQGQEYIITHLGYHHLVRQGRALIHIFHVSDGALDFRLRCDTETLHWVLEEVCDASGA